MHPLNDMEHFVLQPGESVILRCKRLPTKEQLEHLRKVIERTFPGAPVLVLPPDIEVFAGNIEVFGVDPGKGDEMTTPTQEDIEAARKVITDAYDAGRMVYARSDADPTDEWFYVHRTANPHVFAWNVFRYSLTKPKDCP